ncbi:transmembrane protein 184C isoform X4 [Fukomys damarensis]|uniref:transmembrane protein 184C isoform X4 n=1 Tax=Fukomys damarensis TaxID=885580 RepID=UPI00053F70FE|nr:transmembrane protein 184C isoform X4 [Fukomys damarensis]
MAVRGGPGWNIHQGLDLSQYICSHSSCNITAENFTTCNALYTARTAAGNYQWLALIKPSAAIYLNTFRDGYEAYIIYNFMIFLNNYLTSQYRDVTAVLESKEQQKHIPPLCCFPPWEMGKVLLFGCKLGVLQYIPVRIVTTVVAVICKSLHVYHEGTFNLKDSCIYLVIISSSSQGVAMYCLTLFYVTFKKEFKPVNAIGKLLSMKLFILVSFL